YLKVLSSFGLCCTTNTLLNSIPTTLISLSKALSTYSTNIPLGCPTTKCNSLLLLCVISGMPLTPIHIRGKKRAAAEAKSAASSLSETSANPDSTKTQVKVLKRKRDRTADASRRASILERLPVEL